MRTSGLTSFLKIVILPISISIISFVIISNLAEKYHNPFYHKQKTTHAAGVMVKGVPIPLAQKKEKARTFSLEEIKGIQREYKIQSHIENIVNNKKWFKLNGLRSLLSVIAWGSLILAGLGIQETYNKYMNSY